MKKGIPILLLLFISSSLFSQQEKSNLKNDFGLNVNAIINKVIFKKVNDEITNPFPDQLSILTYRHFVSPKLALRFGFDYDQFLRNDSIISAFSGTLVEDDKFLFHAFHFGIQKNIVDNKKVKLTLGWDWLFRRELQEKIRNDIFFGGGINLEEFTAKEIYKEVSLGIGIPIGIQYYINDRIFISTELSFEVFQTFSKNKTEYNGTTNNDFRDNSDTINLNFRPPLAMFVNYRF